ncbi:MAG: cytochrome c [Myxococcales bacterium]
MIGRATLALPFARSVRFHTRLVLAATLALACSCGSDQQSASPKPTGEPAAPKPTAESTPKKPTAESTPKPTSRPPRALAGPVPEVSGPSWLAHLGLAVGTTDLGLEGGGGKPPQTTAHQPMPDAEHTNVLFTVSGADIYRYSCRACHGPEGLGAPDQTIPSLIPFVESMSPSLLGARMAKQGHPASKVLLQELVAGGESALRTRLKAGGEKMPPLSHLRDDEVDALIAYLKALAHAPSDEHQSITRKVPAARAGQLLVKGTCHVCHDATGPGGAHLTMMRGTIPSLDSLTHAYGVEQVIDKVQRGKIPMMGMHGESKMPVLSYLAAQEITAARVYLTVDPPSSTDRWPPLPTASR